MDDDNTLCVCTIRVVRISYDPPKNQRNIRNRGLSFDSAAEFDFEGALYAVDERQDYGERRYVAVGLRWKPAACPLLCRDLGRDSSDQFPQSQLA